MFQNATRVAVPLPPTLLLNVFQSVDVSAPVVLVLAFCIVTLGVVVGVLVIIIGLVAVTLVTVPDPVGILTLLPPLILNVPLL